MAEDVEILVTELRAKLAQYERQMLQAANKTEAALNRIDKKVAGTNRALQRGLGGNQRFTRGMDDIIGRAPIVGGHLQGMGAAGLIAAAGVGAAAVAVNRAMEAMDFGDQLQAQADKLRISAEALQELQFAAEETDVPLEALGEGIEKLNARLGAFRTGFGDAKVKGAFELLGISKESLRDVHDATELLPILADKISALQSTADQTRVAAALGIEDLLPLLRQGSKGMEEMAARARELGLVLSNETVRALSEADRQMEVATRQIQSNLRAAFAGLAVDIAAATTELAQFINWMRNVEREAPSVATAVASIFNQIAGALNPATPGLRYLEQVRRSQAVRGQTAPGGIGGAVGSFRGAQTGAFPTLAGRTGSAGRSGPSAEDEARKRREQARRVWDLFQQAAEAELSAQSALAETAQERFDLSREQARLDRTEFEESLRRKVEDKELTELQAEELDLEHRRLEALKAQAAEEELSRAKAEEIAQARQMAAESEMEMLRLLADLATTSGERRAIELRLVDLAYQLEEERLKQLLAEKGLTDAARAHLQAQLDSLQTRKGLAVEGVNRAHASPLQRYAQDLEFTTDKMEEMAVRGLEALNDGLVDAIVNAEDLGDVARNIFRQIAADLAKMLVQKNVTEPLANFLQSAISAWVGGSTGTPTGGTSGGTGKLASGTLRADGGRYRVGEYGPEFVNIPKGAQVFPASMVRAIESLNPGALSGMGGVHVSLAYSPTIDARGADVAAIMRLERVLAEDRATFAQRTKSVVADAIDRRQIRVPN